MKIIDNKKDYYDYLSGIYGIDEYVTYDRRGSEVISKSAWESFKIPTRSGKPANYKISLIAGEKHWDMFFIEGRRLMTEEEWRMKNDEPATWRFYDPFPFIKEPDLTVNTPLLLYYQDWGRAGTWEIIKNPILAGTPIPAKIPANEVWQGIYDYLLKMKEPEIVDSRSDEEKIESHGFDKKTSFRNIK